MNPKLHRVQCAFDFLLLIPQAERDRALKEVLEGWLARTDSEAQNVRRIAEPFQSLRGVGAQGALELLAKLGYLLSVMDGAPSDSDSVRKQS